MPVDIELPDPKVPLRWEVYLISRVFGPFITNLLGGLYVSGVHHIPDEGPALICANHVSYLDPPLVALTNTKRRTCFMAKDDLFEVPFVGALLRRVYTYPVDRDDGGRQGLRIAMQLLEAGELVAMYPEGTRSPDGDLLPAKLGPALLASRLGVPIVPLGTWGTDIALPRHSKRLYRCPMYYCYGKPLPPPTGVGGKRPTKEELRLYTDELMARIERLKDRARSLAPEHWIKRAARMKADWQAAHAEEIAEELRRLRQKED